MATKLPTAVKHKIAEYVHSYCLISHVTLGDQVFHSSHALLQISLVKWPLIIPIHSWSLKSFKILLSKKKKKTDW